MSSTISFLNTKADKIKLNRVKSITRDKTSKLDICVFQHVLHIYGDFAIGISL